jgi:hypothetical protein
MGKMVNGLISLLIALSIATVPLYYIPAFDWFEPYLNAFEWFVVIIFTAEYILRAWSADKPFNYIFSWYGIIDLAAIIPFYLELFGIIRGSHLFLMLRILRILKLGKANVHGRSLSAEVIADQHGEFRALDRERVDYVIQKHPLIFLLMMLPSFLFLSIGLIILVGFKAAPIAFAVAVLFFAFSGLYFLKAWLDFHYDVIYITNHRLIIQNRQLFGSKLNDVVYEAITNVRPDNTGFLSFIFGFGHIYIQTAAVDGTKHFTHIAKPHLAAEQIYRHRQRILEKDNAIHPDAPLNKA